ncbi:hypothetical protein niasHT_021466 [Heterodera trifolii]|uniref:CCHC-type domain-containing protein n=1 Tax=Heterodera trifolii TaxID=157864 RepID=A0ABD2KJ53_9BILA
MASTIKSKLPYHLLTQVVEKEMRAGGAFNCTELRRAIASIVEVKEEVQRCTQIFRGEEKPRNFPPHSNEGRANQGRGTPFRFSRPFREERWRPVEGNETVRRMSPQPNLSFSAINKQQTPILNRGSNRICSLCEAKGHAPSRCTKYTTPGARRKRLADQERSINCLISGHNSQNCTSPRRCIQCGEKQHFILCYGRGTNFPPNQLTQGHERPDKRNDSVGMMSPQVDRSFLTLTSPQFSQREIGTGTRQTCSLCCAVGHPPGRCPQYCTPGARRRRLAKQQKCFNCLMKGHKAQQCQSPKRCLKCGGKHHYMICYHGDVPIVNTHE